MQDFDLKDSTFTGAAWYDPQAKRFNGGRIGYRGGILVDVSTIQAVNVLSDLLGLARPKYTLDAALRIVSTPELVLSVDTETVTSGNEKVQPLQEALISEKSFSRKSLECDLNIAHIVVEDRAAMKASHDVLRLNIEDAAQEIARMRNSQIGTELMTCTQSGTTDEEWDDATAGVSNHNPMNAIGVAYGEIIANGYMPDYMAVNILNWAEFLQNTHIAPMVQAGILNLGGGNAKIVLPGYPTVQVLTDQHITFDTVVIGASRGTILAEGPTEAVRYRNELQRYTGYQIRQYIDPEICIDGAVRHFHID